MPITTEAVFNNNLKERVNFDGSMITDIANLKVLIGNDNGTGNYCTPREQGSTSGYTPPTGKQFRAVGMMVTHMAGAGVVGIQTATSDVGNGSSSAPTSPDMTSTTSTHGTPANNSINFYDHHMILDAGRYFMAYLAGNRGSVMIVGFEEDVPT